MKKRLTVRTKLMLAVCVIIVAAFSFCIGIYYYFFTKHKNEDAQLFLNATVSSVKENLTQFEKDINQIAVLPYYSEAMRIVNKHAASPSLYISNDDISDMSSHLFFIKSMKRFISNAYIPLLNGKLFTIHYMNIANTWTFSNMPWLRDCATDGSLTMLPYHDASFVEGEAKNAVSIVRALKNLDNMETIAYLVIDIDPEKFSYLVPQNPTYGEQIYIFNEQEQLVYPFVKTMDDPERLQTISHFADKNYLQADAEVKSLGLRIIGVLDKNNYSTSTRNLLQVLIITCLIILFISAIILLLITRSFSKPIQKLHEAMLALSQNNFKTHIEIKTGDEMEDLADGFNRMVQEIQSLLTQIEKANDKERKILFTLLQGQMSPHFIYNSLETLNSMAMLAGNFKLAEGIVCLSRLMRHLTDNSEQEDYLIEELNFVDDYIYIQNLSNGVQIDFVQDVDFTQEYLRVPKFILQPLIENAYRHAGKTDKIELTIKSIIRDTHLILTVSNNGKGISQERIEQIMSQINNENIGIESRRQKHGFALRNIHQRIRLLYGEEYGLSIKNQGEEGFEIILDLPVIWDEENENTDS